MASLTLIGPAFSQVNTGTVTCNPPNGLQATCSGAYPSDWTTGEMTSGGWWSNGYEVITVYMRDYGFQSLEEEYVQGPTDGSTDGNDNITGMPQYYLGTSYELNGIYVWYEYGWWGKDAWGEDYWYCEQYTSWYYIPKYCTSCFAPGTPVRIPNGSKPIEQLRAGDLVMSSRQTDSDGDVVPRRISEVTVSRGGLLDITVKGKVIRATKTHPFYVKGRGWTPAASLNSGDFMRSHDQQWCPVESVVTGTTSPVYNLSVEKDSTYFIGDRQWDFSVWVSGVCDRSSTAGNFLALGSANAPVSRFEHNFGAKSSRLFRTAMANSLLKRRSGDSLLAADFPGVAIFSSLPRHSSATLWRRPASHEAE